MKYIRNATYTVTIMMVIFTGLSLLVLSDRESYLMFRRCLYCLVVSIILSAFVFLFDSGFDILDIATRSIDPDYRSNELRRDYNTRRLNSNRIRRNRRNVNIRIHNTYFVADYNRYHNPYSIPDSKGTRNNRK